MCSKPRCGTSTAIAETTSHLLRHANLLYPALADSESARFTRYQYQSVGFRSFRENDRIAPIEKRPSALAATSSRVLEPIHLRLHCPLKCRPRFTALLVGT
jgi:hypothetical protein